MPILIAIYYMLCSSLIHADEINLEKGYQREIQFLKAQKDSLLQMKRDLEQSLKTKRTLALKDLALKRQKLQSLSLKSEEARMNYENWQKNIKDSSKSLNQVEKINIKLYESVREIAIKMGEGDKSISSPYDIEKNNRSSPRDLLQKQLNETQRLLNSMSKPTWRDHAFVGVDNHLVAGEVLFIGPFAAIGKHKGKEYLLTPHQQNWLKVISPVESDSNQSTYFLFNPHLSEQTIKAEKTWKEGFADMTPAIIMGFVMLAAIFLFIGLARV